MDWKNTVSKPSLDEALDRFAMARGAEWGVGTADIENPDQVVLKKP